MAVVSFTANPPHIKAGESSTLAWKTEGAENCFIQPPVPGSPPNGDVTCNGEVKVSPERSTVYMLGTQGSPPTSWTVLVEVTPN